MKPAPSAASLNIVKKQMITMNTQDPIPDGKNMNFNPILKKKIISYPISKLEEVQIPEKEYRRLLKTEHKYRTQLQAQQTADEIADFERRTTGKYKTPPRIEFEHVDRNQLRILKYYEKTESLDEIDLIQNKRARSVINGVRVINRPSGWNVIDAPLAPSKVSTQNYKPKEIHSKAFHVPTGVNGGKGIPIYNKDIQKISRKKMFEYEKSLRYLYTCDNQIKEQNLRSRVAEDRRNLLNKHEERQIKCAQLGQHWALRATGQWKEKIQKKEEEKIYPEDLEALDYLRQRDDELTDQRRAMRRESEGLDPLSL